jgi:thiamine biosynthesis lipoprotein
MGGRLELHVRVAAAEMAAAERDLERLAERIRAWAAFLTRHDPASPLMLLNGDPRTRVPVGPTLAAALAWGGEAGDLTGGAVDVALLDARIAVETELDALAGETAGPTRPEASTPAGPGEGSARRGWDLEARRHGSALVARQPGVHFDLDGVGKGWLADRALASLGRPAALVDADGDIAVRAAFGEPWRIGIGDPRDDGAVLAVLALPGGTFGPRIYGVATSGTSIHRWGPAGGARHHLIDPLSRRPALTDVVQATVVAGSAREAEAWAKAIVIRGAAAGLELVENGDALGAVALLADGRTVALPRTEGYLA